MTAYQLLPALDSEQYDALRADIKAHGIRIPVDVDDNGQVLDGHHRSLIAVNAHRRHLTQEQRRAVLAASIKAEPEASDREHARRVGSSPSTASAVRADLESDGQVSNLDSRRGSDGRTRLASQPPRPQPSPAPASTPAESAAPAGRDPIGAGEPNVPLGLSKQATTTEAYVDTAAMRAAMAAAAEKRPA